MSKPRASMPRAGCWRIPMFRCSAWLPAAGLATPTPCVGHFSEGSVSDPTTIEPASERQRLARQVSRPRRSEILPGSRPPSRLHRQTGKQLVEGDRIVPDPRATGVVDRIRDRGAGAPDAEFADALALERIGLVVELGEKNGIDGWNIGMHRHVIFGEVVIDEIAEAGLARHGLVQRRSDAEHHASDRLGPGRLRVQDAAGREHAQHASQTYFAGIGVDADFGETCAVGLLREILVVAATLDLAVGVP